LLTQQWHGLLDHHSMEFLAAAGFQPVEANVQMAWNGWTLSFFPNESTCAWRAARSWRAFRAARPRRY
jgi:hypothetical protein